MNILWHALEIDENIIQIFLAQKFLQMKLTRITVLTVLLYSVDSVQVTFPHDNNVAIATIERHQLILALARQPRGIEEAAILTHVKSKRFSQSRSCIPRQGARHMPKGGSKGRRREREMLLSTHGVQ